MRNSARARHLIFLGHIWAMLPFALAWLWNPDFAKIISPAHTEHMRLYLFVVIMYFAVRTWLAFIDPPWLNWEYVYPLVDVGLVTVMLAIGDRDPLGNVTIMYFLPIAEAAGTLKIRYAGSVAVLCVLGTALATFGNVHEKTYNIIFRFVFLVLMASLFTFLARRAAEIQAQLRVAADRNRLALEMHDGVQAHLISAASQMELIQHVAPKDGVRAAELAQESRGIIRAAADELRFLVQRLRAPALDAGLLPALRHYAHHFCERHGLQLQVDVSGDSVPLASELENLFFRIAQESLNNIVKHATATAVRICFTYTETGVSIDIHDNGKGFDPRSAAPSFGLDGMKERATELGGTVTIASNPGEGVCIRAEVPLKRKKSTYV